MNKYHSGDVCPKTGDYACYNADGKLQRTTHYEKGERFAPTQRDDAYYTED